MRYFHYLDQKTGTLLRIKAARRPSRTTIPRPGTWRVQEFVESSWLMPSFPEITFSTIEKCLTFLGSVALESWEKR